MRARTAFLTLCLGLAACTGLEPLTETLSERVAIETVNLPGRLWDPFMPPLSDGNPVTIEGLLTVPVTDTPVPAVILMHGCGGIGGGELGWVEDLEEAGIATLLVDSFAGRGVGEICSGRETVNVGSMLVDVYRAAEVLDSHPHVDGSRLAVMGLSFGGRSSLWSALTRFQEAYGGRPLAGYVAFYPSTCFIRLENEHLVAGGPIRIFHGTDDDWTPIGQCQDFVGRLTAQGVDAVLHEYPGALHAFDDAALAWGVSHLSLDDVSPRNCSFVEESGAIMDPETGAVAGVGSTCVERGVHTGYDAKARDAAKTDLIAFLSEIFSR